MPDPATTQEEDVSEIEALRANRDLWVRRHAELESLIETIRWQLDRFEEGVERKGNWSYECGADDLVAIGWARVLCDLAFEPPSRRPEGFLFSADPEEAEK